MQIRLLRVSAALFAAALAGGARAQPIVPPAGTSSYATVNAFPHLTFEDPLFMAPVPGSNLLMVAGRQGQIWTFVNSAATTSKNVFLDLRAHTQGWGDSGILGFAFHPEYGKAGSPNRGYLYVWYSYTPGPLVGSAAAPPNYNTTPTYNRLSRFTVPDGAAAADPSSEFVMINQFDRDLWHDGGGMFFGSDGFLYLTVGDEGGLNDVYGMSQTINLGLFGGVLRIDVDRNSARSHPIRRQPVPDPGATVPAGWPPTYTQGYYIPNDNPWMDPSGGVLEEFWAIGLRSPHRMTRDPVTGNVWIGDVGQAAYEEVDLLQKGGNYEWPMKEGFHAGPTGAVPPTVTYGTMVDPVYEYGRINNDGCVIGGYVYRGAQFAPALGGQYIFGDYRTNFIWAMTYGGSGTPVVNYLTSLPLPVKGIGALSSFAVDAAGEIYLLTMGPAASIYTLAPAASAGHLINLSARAAAGAGQQQLAAGFVISGSGSKQLLVRGIGPGLAQYGVSNCVTDTQLTVTDQNNSSLANNQHWCTGGNQAALTSAAQSCGAFPLATGSTDSALLETLASGIRVAQVAIGTSAPGTGLAELYDLAPTNAPGAAQLINLSCRAQVTASASSTLGNLVGGFSIGGTGPVRLLIRGIGRGLSGYGVSNYLPNPVLTLYDSQGNIITSNDDWDSLSILGLSTTAQAVGAFALNQGSQDSALLVTLAPGVYTAQVSSADGQSGVALLELYVAP